MPDEPLHYTDIPENSSLRRIRFATFQGGGMKGIGDVGALEEMEALGVMDQLEEVAGSSVGGLVALLVALGYTAKEIRQEMLAMNFSHLQDKETPGWIESSGIKDILQGGAEAVAAADKFELLRRLPRVKAAIAAPAKIMEAAEAVEDVFTLAFGKDLGLWKRDALQNLISRLIVRKTGKPNLTFSELSALAKAKPGKFRALHLTGSNLTTHQLETYNVEDWPDLPILDALNVSMCFPGAYRPVTKPFTEQEKIDLANGIVTVRVDGGLLQNLPDVFNRPPYFEPTAENPSNKEVLAIAFKKPLHKKQHQFKNGLDLARGLYSTVMSEQELHDKYEDRIVYIDTKGMGTLEFNADKEKQLMIANSGSEGVRSVFRKILNGEKETEFDFDHMTVTELMRQKVALYHMLAQRKARLPEPETKRLAADQEIKRQTAEQETKRQTADQETKRLSAERETNRLTLDPETRQLMSDLRKVEQRIQQAHIAPKVLEEMETVEKNKLTRRLNRASTEVLSDQELVDICQERKKELSRLSHELERKARQLRLVKQGFEWRLVELQARYVDKNFKNEFVNQLQELGNYQELIRKNRDELLRLELERKSPESEMTQVVFEKRNKELQEEYRWLLHAKELYFRGVLTKYIDQRDELMAHFFMELQEDSQDINFEIPGSREQVTHFYGKQTEICNEYILECKEALKSYKQEKKMIETLWRAFSTRSPLAERYEILKELKTEIDRAIFAQTSLIAKINHYLVDDKPTLKNNLITALMQTVAFAAFIVRIASVVPLLTYGVAHLIRRSSPSDSKRRATADRVIDAFSMPNLFKLKKLRAFTHTTAHVLKVLDENYTTADISEHSYLFKLLAYNLKNTGLTVAEVFPKKEAETDQSYRERIKTLEKNLELIAPDNMVLLDERHPGNRNVAEFRRKVLTQVLQMKEHEPPSISSSDVKRRAEYSEKVMRQNLEQIHKEFVQYADKKRKEGLLLTRNEVVDYVESAQLLHRKIADPIKDQYLLHIHLKVEADNKLTEEELKNYQSFSKSLHRLIPEAFKNRYADWFDASEKKSNVEQKMDSEMKNAMDEFIWQRKRSPQPKFNSESAVPSDKPKKIKPKKTSTRSNEGEDES